MQLLLIPIVIAATLLTYAASLQVLKRFAAVGPPRLIAAMVALLSGLSLLSLGGGVVALILIPYGALGLSLLLLPLLQWLLRSQRARDWARWFQHQPPGDRRHLPETRSQSRTSKTPTSARRPQAPLTEEE